METRRSPPNKVGKQKLALVRFGSMLLKKSVTNDERAIFDSYQTVSWINILRCVLFLNQYCSEIPLKIFFQQHRS